MTEKDIWDELDLIKQSIKSHTGSPFGASPDKVNNVIKGIQGEKMEAIRKVLDEINVQIAERRQLSESVITEINSISAKVDSMLMQVAGNADTHREQLSLKEKQILIEEAKIKERVECWRDVAQLRREQRERIKEFTDQESKINLMDNILSNKPA